MRSELGAVTSRVPWFGDTGLVSGAPQGWFKPPKRFFLVLMSLRMALLNAQHYIFKELFALLIKFLEQL
jgi:hypothetical protein